MVKVGSGYIIKCLFYFVVVDKVMCCLFLVLGDYIVERLFLINSILVI